MIKALTLNKKHLEKQKLKTKYSRSRRPQHQIAMVGNLVVCAALVAVVGMPNKVDDVS